MFINRINICIYVGFWYNGLDQVNIKEEQIVLKIFDINLCNFFIDLEL